jgi:hypothetical protein
MGTFWDMNGSLQTHAYIPFSLDLAFVGVLNFFTYFLLLNTLLPISLIVAMEVVKAFQALLVIWDTKIIDT